MNGVQSKRNFRTIDTSALLVNRHQESLAGYIDCFRAYKPLEENDTFSYEYFVHVDSENVDGGVHVNMYESHESLGRLLSPHRVVSENKLTPHLRELQLRRRVYGKTKKEDIKYF